MGSTGKRAGDRRPSEAAVIARIWRGVTREERAEEYFGYLLETGLAEYRGTKGNRGVMVLRRMVEGKAEFLLVSLWDSLEAIRSFAGEEIERAVYYPKDREFLLEMEPRVVHYEVLVDRPDGLSVP